MLSPVLSNYIKYVEKHINGVGKGSNFAAKLLTSTQLWRQPKNKDWKKQLFQHLLKYQTAKKLCKTKDLKKN